MPASSPHNETFLPTTLSMLTVAGAVAGNITVTGIGANDILKHVLRLDSAADLTSEFSISAANTINNTGGTSSAGGVLLVVWDAKPANLGSN